MKLHFNSPFTVESFIQFIKFAIVGASNTFISYFVYLLSLAMFRHFGLFSRIDNYVSVFCSYVLSVFWSFILNYKYVFKYQVFTLSDVIRSLIKVYLSYMFTGLILSNILMFIWLEIIKISEYIAPLVNSLICVPINFVLNKYWAFGNQ